MTEEMGNALRTLLGLKRQIFIDIGQRHAERAKTADDLTVQLDADFRAELEDAFNAAEEALTITRTDEVDDDRLEAVARAIAIPEHHTGYDRLTAQEKDLYRMQAYYAMAEMRYPAPVPDEVVRLREACGDALELLNMDIITPDAINRVGRTLEAALHRSNPDG
jgi:hypothetical protein